MLVDDEKDFVEALAERLKLRDLDIHTAFSGIEALDKLGYEDFDVIILDVKMPGEDGTDILLKIKEKKPLTQVIMLTGQATIESAIEGMKRGAYDFKMKPTDTDELVRKITDASNIKKDHEKRIQDAEIENIVKRRGW